MRFIYRALDSLGTPLVFVFHFFIFKTAVRACSLVSVLCSPGQRVTSRAYTTLAGSCGWAQGQATYWCTTWWIWHG